MTHTTRLLAIFVANSLILASMLISFSRSGIDILDTTLVDNANNLWFMLDYMAFMVVGIVVNFFLITYPTRKRRTIEKIIAILESRPAQKRSNKNHGKRQAA